jgi:hypothetical protein
MLKRIRNRNRFFCMFPAAADWYESYLLARSFSQWRRDGFPVPAPHPVKRALLLREAKRLGATAFVETGTFTGDTVWFMRDAFEKIYSIEVQPDLAHLASKRFSNHSHIRIIEGDSAIILNSLMKELNEPTLFWLDGHYSAGVTGRGEKDCPIYEELEAIATRTPPAMTIVIDDYRCFGTEEGYPTWEELCSYIKSKFPKMKIKIELDMIWCQE